MYLSLSMSFCRLPFQTLMSPPPPPPFKFFFRSTQPLRSYNHKHHSDSVTAHFSQAYLSCVVSSCFCPPSSRCSDFCLEFGCLVLVSLVVLCSCRQVSSHGFDFLPSSGRTQSIICSLPSSTPPPPTTDHPCGNLSPPAPTPISPCGDYYFVTPP